MSSTKTQLSLWQKIGFGVTVACLVLMGVLVLRHNASVDSMRREYRENEATKLSIQSEIDALSQDDTDPGELQQTVYSASIAGTKVAEYQTDFQQCYLAEDVQAALSENMARLRGCFVADCGAGMDVWYKLSESSNMVTWSFMTNYGSVHKELPVMWMCFDGKGHLCAYTTGVYHGDTGLFSDIVYTQTTYGNSMYTDIELFEGGLDEGNYQEPVGVDLPSGYVIDGNGQLVDSEGNPYVLSGEDDEVLEWQGNFTDDFEGEFQDAVEARRQAVEAARGGAEG